MELFGAQRNGNSFEAQVCRMELLAAQSQDVVTLHVFRSTGLFIFQFIYIMIYIYRGRERDTHREKEQSGKTESQGASGQSSPRLFGLLAFCRRQAGMA